MRLAAAEMPALEVTAEAMSQAPLNHLTDSSELGLIRELAGWPRLLEGAAEACEPHRVAFYLYDVAAAFHGLWTKGKEEAQLRFLVPENPDLTRARLALVMAVQSVVASGLHLFGVEPLEEM